jgi:hypothetical protein
VKKKKVKYGILQQKEKIIKTTDDFASNYDGSMVKVKVSQIRIKNRWQTNFYSKLIVAGNDDLIYEIEKPGEEYHRLENIYDNLPEPITIKWLTENGFRPF